MGDIEINRGSMRGGLMHIKRLGLKPGTIIDVGAALGTFELYEVFPESRHFLIEPIVENEPYLDQICRKIGNAEYIIAAATRKPGTVNLTVHPALVHSSVSSNDVTSDEENSERRIIPGITLDQICRERNLETPYLIKIDVDGKEVDVLAGATQILKSTEYVIVEVSLFGQLYEVMNFMKLQGFTVYDIVDLGYRPLDNALWQCDMAFVKESSKFRNNNSYIEKERGEALDAHLNTYRERYIAYIKKNYSDGNPTLLSHKKVITKELRLRDINLIIFPDWSLSEELLYQDLAIVLRLIATQPDKNRMTLLIDIRNISEEDANLILSGIVINLLREENLDIADGPELSLVGNISERQWEALILCIQARILFENENQQAIAAVRADNIPVYELSNFSI